MLKKSVGIFMVASLKTGVKAPNFTLLNHDGEKVSLSDFQGKYMVVVYFYPKAMTPGCTIQAQGIRDAHEELAELNAIVLAISPDTPDKLQMFCQKEKLNFQLLSDPDHKIAELYGAWGDRKSFGKESVGILRSTFIVNEEGNIAQTILKVKTATHHEDVLTILENLS